MILNFRCYSINKASPQGEALSYTVRLFSPIVGAGLDPP